VLNTTMIPDALSRLLFSIPTLERLLGGGF
jgi:hypothetical protein